MATWQLRIFKKKNTYSYKNGKIHEYENHWILECTDVGEINEVYLSLWVDNYPYYAGSFTADGIRFLSLEGKLYGLACRMGIQLPEPDLFLPTLPDDQPIILKTKNGNPVIPKSGLADFVHINDLQLWISDPRIILLAFYVLHDTDEQIRMKSNPPPSREEAIKILHHYDLKNEFSPIDFKHKDNAYDIFDRMRHDWNYEALKPDPATHTYIQTIQVAGTFKIKMRKEVLQSISVKTPIRLMREPDNPYDHHAIAVYAECKLGYIPRANAAVLAPVMDHEACLSVRVAQVNPETGLILLDLYRRNPLPLEPVASIHFEQQLHHADHPDQVDVFLQNRTIVRTHFPEKIQGVCYVTELTFTPEQWEQFALPLLQRCNFFAWMMTEDHASPEKFGAWSIRLDRKDGTYVTFSGKTTHPEEWSFWKQFMTESFDLSAMRGNGHFSIRAL